MRRFILCGIVFLIGAFLAFSGALAQQLSIGKAGEVGMSQPVLNAAKMLYSEAVARDEIAGAVLLVARQGKIVLHEPLGWSDRENRVPMTPDTLFQIASMTKPILATAALILAERGQINLDDPVSKYIPQFSVDRSSRIMIKHLLNHTSGFRIPDLFVGPLLQRSPENPNAPSLQTEAARFPHVGPVEEPGTTYSYSNPGYNTLAAVLEIASGKLLHELLKQLIYDPIGMMDTFQLFGNIQNPRFAKQYMIRGCELIPTTPPRLPFAIGAGQTISTALDFAKFCQMYLNGGIYDGRRVLDANSIKLATSITVRSKYLMPDPEQLQARNLRPRWWYRRDGRGLGLDTGYGFGWCVTEDGIFSHPGVTGTFAWVDPRRDLIGMILTQSNDARNPGIEFGALVNAAVDSVGR